jgi:DNA-binding CsgD family transcriptional regulator
MSLAPEVRPSRADSPDFSPFPSPATGRPRALDAQAKERICHWLRQGMSFKQAAAYVACHPETIRNERRRDPQFDFDVRRTLAMREMEPLDTIRRQAKYSWRAAVWLINYRERKKAEREAKRAAKLLAQSAEAIDDAADPPPSPTPSPAPPVAAEETQTPRDQSFSPSPPSAPDKVLEAMIAVMDRILYEQRLTPTTTSAARCRSASTRSAAPMKLS